VTRAMNRTTVWLLAAVTIGCDDNPAEPGARGEPGLTIVAGANGTDTIEAVLPQA
jgi:hypothetical protein